MEMWEITNYSAFLPADGMTYFYDEDSVKEKKILL